MTNFEDHIRAMTVPRNDVYPRPWTTDMDPDYADVLIVGASSAKMFHVSDVGNHDQFLDALWNRNGQTCRAMYDAVTKKPSRTRSNLDRLSEMLTARGLTSLQTNVTCASAPYDAQVRKEARLHGTELFKVVVAQVPWRAMIVYGVGASERFGRAFGMAMPPVPSPNSTPIWTTVQGRAVFVSPTLAFPSYRSSVWPYLERVVATIANDPSSTGAPAARPTLSSTARSLLCPRENAIDTGGLHVPAAFNTSDANLLVWRRMQEIEATTGLKLRPGTQQAALIGGLEFSSTDRVLRHKFKRAKPDLLVREDVFRFDSTLREAATWTTHKKSAFLNVVTDDLQLLGRILNAVGAFAATRMP